MQIFYSDVVSFEKQFVIYSNTVLSTSIHHRVWCALKMSIVKFKIKHEQKWKHKLEPLNIFERLIFFAYTKHCLVLSCLMDVMNQNYYCEWKKLRGSKEKTLNAKAFTL